MKNIEKLFVNTEFKTTKLLEIIDHAKNYDLPTGICLVVSDKNELLGTITEGDIRRHIINKGNLSGTAKEMMNSSPITFSNDLSISQILDLLPKKLIRKNRKSTNYLNKILVTNESNIPIKVLDYHQIIEQKLGTHRHVTVLGLGYVGLTLALVMADSGFLVTGVDLDKTKCKLLNDGKSYVHEKGLDELLHKNLNQNFFVDNKIPKNADVYIISVGTPIDTNSDGEKFINMKYLIDSATQIGKIIRSGSLLILRSTVPIGTCRKIVIPIVENLSGLKCGIDFHFSFAPERTAEGKAIIELKSLPQIIGGINKDSVNSTAAIFRDVTSSNIIVDSIESAEMIKLLNNTFRDYIFAFSNKVSQIASKFNIDIFKTIQAANEGYIRDPIPLPSPGVGGPCLTKDPYIFASSNEETNMTDNFFANSRNVNESMFEYIHQLVLKELNRINKETSKCNLLICGLGFKGYPETGDIRNSTSIDIMNLFKKNNFNKIFAYDAVASDNEIINYDLIPFDIHKSFTNIDVVLFLNNHKSFEEINIKTMVNSLSKNPIIFDGWNLFSWKEIISIKESTYLGLSLNKSSIII